MPRTKSAKKALRQTTQRTAANRARRSRVRTAVKAVRNATTPEAREAAFRRAEKELDRAGAKGLIHRNTANRLKARLAKGTGK